MLIATPAEKVCPAVLQSKQELRRLRYIGHTPDQIIGVKTKTVSLEGAALLVYPCDRLRRAPR